MSWSRSKTRTKNPTYQVIQIWRIYALKGSGNAARAARLFEEIEVRAIQAQVARDGGYRPRDAGATSDVPILQHHCTRRHWIPR